MGRPSNPLPESIALPERVVYNWAAFADLGLLWLVNRAVFHPRGFALALDYAEGDPEPRGWSLYGGSEPWSFGEDVPEDERFAAVEALLALAREHGVAPPENAPLPFPEVATHG